MIQSMRQQVAGMTSQTTCDPLPTASALCVSCQTEKTSLRCSAQANIDLTPRLAKPLTPFMKR